MTTKKLSVPTEKTASALDYINGASKTAFVFEPVSQTIGGLIGYHKGKQMADKDEEVPDVGIGTVAGALFLPGGLGYVVGKRIGHYAGKQEKMRTALASQAALAHSAPISSPAHPAQNPQTV